MSLNASARERCASGSSIGKLEVAATLQGMGRWAVLSRARVSFDTKVSRANNRFIRSQIGGRNKGADNNDTA